MKKTDGGRILKMEGWFDLRTLRRNHQLRKKKNGAHRGDKIFYGRNEIGRALLLGEMFPVDKLWRWGIRRRERAKGE